MDRKKVSVWVSYKVIWVVIPKQQVCDTIKIRRKKYLHGVSDPSNPWPRVISADLSKQFPCVLLQTEEGFRSVAAVKMLNPHKPN